MKSLSFCAIVAGWLLMADLFYSSVNVLNPLAGSWSLSVMAFIVGLHFLRRPPCSDQ